MLSIIAYFMNNSNRGLLGRRKALELEKQLDEFYSMLDIRPVSSNAISLYFVIIEIVKKANWRKNIKIANSILTSKTKLSI